MKNKSRFIKKILAAGLTSSILFSMGACSNTPAETPSFFDCDIPGIDSVLEFPEGEDITILQLADIQAMNYEGIRDVGHRWSQVDGAFFSSGVTDNHTRYWQYVEEGVEKTDPDLIVLTGDNIYGETDDSGELWLEMIEVLDSFKIPWLCIFGNHDNESNMGLHWQIEAVSASKYGYMREGICENGNCNYTVGIKQGEEFKYIFYMLDTNGCCVKKNNYGESLMINNPDIDDIQQDAGIYPDQMEWMLDCDEKITAEYGEIPSMIFLHIPPVETYYSVAEKYADTYGTWPFYTDRDGDLGMSMEGIGGIDTAGEFFKVAKELNCTGMFMGHQHKVATSTTYDGIRLTYGLKTGTGDYHSPEMLGVTKITLKAADSSFEVEYIHSEIDYPLD